MGDKKKIVVLGAGFAGLRAVLTLAKQRGRLESCEITLVDKTDIHLYTPDLYEIATAYYPKITEECQTELRETVAVKLETLLVGKPVRLVRDTVLKIDPDNKKIFLKNTPEPLLYDYLLVALGSATNYRKVPGLEQFSYPLKTIYDALDIQCHLDLYFQNLWKAGNKKEVHIVVGGGGATGLEFAAELPSYIDKICGKYSYPRQHVTITLIEGKKELLGSGDFSAKAMRRLGKRSVTVRLGAFITQAEAGGITVRHDEKETKIGCDMLIWAGGVSIHPLVAESFPTAVTNGTLNVNEFMEIPGYKNVYAAGDGLPHPWLAYMAIAEGKCAAENIVADINGGPKKIFKPKNRGVVVTMGGKYGIYKSMYGVFSGFLWWLVHRFVSLDYFLSIMPFSGALKKWWHATGIFAQND